MRKFLKMSRSHLKIPDARRMTKKKFHTEVPQIVDTDMQDVVTMVSWQLEFAHPCTDCCPTRFSFF